MKMERRIGFGFVLAVAALTMSCGGGPTNPSSNQVENFNGTITPVSLGGTGLGQIANFTVSNTGELTITVPTITPAPNNYLGLYLGNTNTDGSCSGSIVNQFVVTGQAAYTNGNILKGSYCVTLVDYAPALTVVTNYTIKVSHP
jgi:hypothetical protein